MSNNLHSDDPSQHLRLRKHEYVQIDDGNFFN